MCSPDSYRDQMCECADVFRSICTFCFERFCRWWLKILLSYKQFLSAMRVPILLLFTIILIACNRSIQRNNEITKVELATSSCFGSCAITAVSIDSSLSFEFYGGSHALKKGYYSGKIPLKIWDSINIKLESVNYKNLYIHYLPPNDDQTLELIVHYKNNKIKHILASSFRLAHVKNSDSTAKVFYWISNIYKSMDLGLSKLPLSLKQLINAIPCYKSIVASKHNQYKY